MTELVVLELEMLIKLYRNDRMNTEAFKVNWHD